MSKSKSMESDKILRYSVIQSISNFEYRISMEPEKAEFRSANNTLCLNCNESYARNHWLSLETPPGQGP